MDGDVLALDLSDCKTNFKTCEQCGNEFEPRNGNGGKPQRFCSTDCRRLFQNGQRSQRGTNAQQTPPTRNAATSPPVVIGQPKPENAPAATPEPSGDFDWNDAEAVVLHEQPATAVYFNKEGSLVIRQRRWPDDDAFIYIAETSIADFLDKLTDICGIPSFGGP
jgi:hypothetical protein